MNNIRLQHGFCNPLLIDDRWANPRSYISFSGQSTGILRGERGPALIDEIFANNESHYAIQLGEVFTVVKALPCKINYPEAFIRVNRILL